MLFECLFVYKVSMLHIINQNSFVLFCILKESDCNKEIRKCPSLHARGILYSR